MKFIFFGSSEFSVYVLDELKLHNILPSLIVTTPDKPKGRKLVLTPNVVKIWAQNHNIKVLAPISLRNNPDLVYNLSSYDYNLFLVASYGKIIPPEIFNIPKHKTLNIHPSLLPKYRGASPIQSQILNEEKEMGVTIMEIEEAMDSGPIVVKKKIKSEVLGRKELEKLLAIEGARLFAHILPEWLSGIINPIIQDESKTSYCTKIKKEDGEINLFDDPHQNILKIRAYQEWPTTYFFLDTPKQGEGGINNKRIIITDAKIENSILKILKVIPEGKKEMLYEDFLRGQK